MKSGTGRVPLWAWAIIGTCVVVVLGVIGVVGYLAYGHFDVGRVAGEAEGAVAAYRKTGLPWVAEDLAPRPRFHPKENAAPLLRQAIGRFDAKRFTAEKKEMDRLVLAGDTASLERRLAPHAAALALAAKAAERPRLDFKRDWDRGPFVLLPEYAPIKGMVQALVLRARARAQRRDVRGMVADLRSARRLGALLTQEPGLVPLLVRIAGERIVLTAVQHCAATFAKDGRALASLRGALVQPLPRISLPFALRAEAYMGISTARNIDLFGGWRALENPQRAEARVDFKRLRRTGLPSDQTARAYLARNLQVWAEAKGEIDRHGDDPIALTQALDRLVERVEKQRSQSNVLNRIVFPVFTQVGEAVAVTETEAVATRALLEALLFRVKKGSFPARLSDLPGDWRDPFATGPLRMKATSGGVRIYSLGPNRRDDGGTDRRELKSAAQERKEYDVVAAFPPARTASSTP